MFIAFLAPRPRHFVWEVLGKLMVAQMISKQSVKDMERNGCGFSLCKVGTEQMQVSIEQIFAGQTSRVARISNGSGRNGVFPSN